MDDKPKGFFDRPLTKETQERHRENTPILATFQAGGSSVIVKYRVKMETVADLIGQAGNLFSAFRAALKKEDANPYKHIEADIQKLFDANPNVDLKKYEDVLKIEVLDVERSGKGGKSGRDFRQYLGSSSTYDPPKSD